MILAALALAAAVGAAPSPVGSPTPESSAARLEAANERYLAGDFDGAARAYAALAADGWESPTLHLNLGNAQLRLGRRGHAVASYERALRLDPADADARANLELARSANVDRLVGASDRPFVSRALERVSDGAAAAAFVLVWAAVWAALAARRRVRARARGVLGAVAILASIASSTAGALLSWRAAERRTPDAVVIAPVAPVREGPSATLKPAFELHEGTAVRVVEARGDLARIRLENGLEGWIAVEQLEVL